MFPVYCMHSRLKSFTNTSSHILSLRYLGMSRFRVVYLRRLVYACQFIVCGTRIPYSPLWKKYWLGDTRNELILRVFNWMKRFMWQVLSAYFVAYFLHHGTYCTTITVSALLITYFLGLFQIPTCMCVLNSPNNWVIKFKFLLNPTDPLQLLPF